MMPGIINRYRRKIRFGPSLAGRGFTLLELLVVLFIIGIILSFAVISVDTRSEKLDQEGRRLAAIVRMASEEAVLRSSEYRLEINRNTYGFSVLKGSEWEKLKDDLLKEHTLTDGFHLALAIENEEVDLAVAGEDNKGAAIYLLSSGEVTSFEIAVLDDYGNGRLNITNIPTGRVEIRSEKE